MGEGYVSKFVFYPDVLVINMERRSNNYFTVKNIIHSNFHQVMVF